MIWFAIGLPFIWLIPHTLIGVLLMLPYGVESIRWHAGAIEVVAKRNKKSQTRIFFRPGAQKLLTIAEYEEIETWSEQMRGLFHITHKLRK